MGAALGPAAGAGMGAAKYWGIERPRENRERNLQANMAYYDNILGNKEGANQAVASLPKEGSVYENMMKGAGMGQQQQDNNSWQQLMKQQQGGGMGGGDSMSGAQSMGGPMAGGPMDAAGGGGGAPWESLMGGAGAGAVPVLPIA